MFLLWLLLIKPETGEFRTKITSLQSEIKAYSLLERNKSETGEEIIINQHIINFVEPPVIDSNVQKMEQEKRKEISWKQAMRTDGKIYWNNGKLEMGNQ